MFFDSLGHGFKDLIILLFIIFTLVLSVYIIILNSSLHWWDDNCRSLSADKIKNHKPNDYPVIISSIFIGITGLTLIYTFYEYFTKGKIVGMK